MSENAGGALMPLKTVAREINVRLEKAAKADDHRIAAGQLLAEARRRVAAGEAGAIGWKAWCEANVERSYRDVQRCLRLVHAPDPQKAAEDDRRDTRDRMRRHREGDDARASPGAEPEPAPELSEPEPAPPAEKEARAPETAMDGVRRACCMMDDDAGAEFMARLRDYSGGGKMPSYLDCYSREELPAYNQDRAYESEKPIRAIANALNKCDWEQIAFVIDHLIPPYSMNINRLAAQKATVNPSAVPVPVPPVEPVAAELDSLDPVEVVGPFPAAAVSPEPAAVSPPAPALGGAAAAAIAQRALRAPKPRPGTLPPVPEWEPPAPTAEPLPGEPSTDPVKELRDLYVAMPTPCRTAAMKWMRDGRPRASDPDEPADIIEGLMSFRATASRLSADQVPKVLYALVVAQSTTEVWA